MNLENIRTALIENEAISDHSDERIFYRTSPELQENSFMIYNRPKDTPGDVTLQTQIDFFLFGKEMPALEEFTQALKDMLTTQKVWHGDVYFQVLIISQSDQPQVSLDHFYFNKVSALFYEVL